MNEKLPIYRPLVHHGAGVVCMIELFHISILTSRLDLYISISSHVFLMFPFPLLDLSLWCQLLSWKFPKADNQIFSTRVLWKHFKILNYWNFGEKLKFKSNQFKNKILLLSRKINMGVGNSNSAPSKPNRSGLCRVML